MKILHVVLGNPRTHQGGLCRYCQELRNEQMSMGYQSEVIYPGSYHLGRNPIIKEKKTGEYTIKDALPVAVTYGIDCPERYMVRPAKNPYKKWLSEKKYDIIHVHSIQGIHKEFFQTAEELGIPIVFTTHDYYPICPRSVLLDRSQVICQGHQAEKCALCNANAGLSFRMQRLIQSPVYQNIKYSKLISKAKRALSSNTGSGEFIGSNEHLVRKVDPPKDIIKKYDSLINYYTEIVNSFSLIHCNSSIAAKQYNTYFSTIKQSIIPITHSGLQRLKHRRESETCLNVGYMGGMSVHKGYQIVIEAFEILGKMGCNGECDDKWKLWLYGGEFSNQNVDEKFIYKGFFHENESKKVWQNLDVLVVASQWYETFGFIVLEALCHGIPVICSDLVGSKDLVSDIDSKLIFLHNDPQELALKIKSLMDREYYEYLTNKIDSSVLKHDMNKHTMEIDKLYSRVI